MNNRGFYSFVEKGLNIRTHYIIEFTRDEQVYNKMDMLEFDYSLLNKIEIDYIEDVIWFYYLPAHDGSVSHLVLFEQIILENEIVLEQFKDFTLPSVKNDRYYQAYRETGHILDDTTKKLNKLIKYLEKYNINWKEIIK